jgi:hypothetical protein
MMGQVAGKTVGKGSLPPLKLPDLVCVCCHSNYHNQEVTDGEVEDAAEKTEEVEGEADDKDNYVDTVAGSEPYVDAETTDRASE